MEAVILLHRTYDSLLGLGLLWLAWQALSCTDLFKAIVLFIAFGLLMALTWVRLDAPDVAIAEAAIGAGLTGALLLAALSRLQAISNEARESDTVQSHIHQVSNDDTEKDQRKDDEIS